MIETCGANADKLKGVSENLKAGVLRQLMGYVDIEAVRGIYHPVTVKTADMVVVIRHAVKPFEAAAEIKPLYLSTGGKNFKVAIYGAKTDAGQPFANHFIDFISAGVGIYFPKFFQNDLTLPRHSQI